MEDIVDLIVDIPQCIYWCFRKGELNEKKIRYKNQLALPEECPICFNEFKYKHKVYQHSCGNIYHIKCLDEWAKINNVCPTCNKQLHCA